VLEGIYAGSASVTKILLATGNPGKIREIKALVQGIRAELIIPSDLNLVLHVEEGGNTYTENAARKALAYVSASGLLTLADDSGLEVEALGGAPGLYSARYAPEPGATDADRRVYLLDQLRGLSRPWIAKFHCTVALTTPDKEINFAEGTCHGEIIPEERGEGGFGYDPIFLVKSLGKTMAELSIDEKNHISHRSKAIRSIIPILQSYL